MKHKTIEQIQYKTDGIAYFPHIDPVLLHGFSWGKNASNMSSAFGDPLETRMSVQKFLTKLNLGSIRDTINLAPEHSDRIVDVDEKFNNTIKGSRVGRQLRADAVFTSIRDLTFTVKMGDCTTAIIYAPAKTENNSVMGLVHSGRRSVELSLPEKAITHLTDKHSCKPEEITVSILPHIFWNDNFFSHFGEFLDVKSWEKHRKKVGNLEYIDETGRAIDQYLAAGIQPENLYEYRINTFEAAKNGEGFSHHYSWLMMQRGIENKEGRFMAAVRLRLA